MNRKIKRTLILAGLAFALLCLVGGIYFGTFCHASPEAKALVRGSETVQVKTTDAGWLLDGPGAKDALIFYPGGKVEPTAYLPLLTALAEDGVDCFLVRMPLNMAFLNVNAAADLRAAYAYEHWYIGGHSLGGAMAAVYAAEHGDGLDGLILLAAYATKPLGEHLAVLELPKGRRPGRRLPGGTDRLGGKKDRISHSGGMTSPHGILQNGEGSVFRLRRFFYLQSSQRAARRRSSPSRPGRTTSAGSYAARLPQRVSPPIPKSSP